MVVEGGGGEASGVGEDRVVLEAVVDCTSPAVVVLVAAAHKDQVVVDCTKTEVEVLVAPEAAVAHKDRMVVGAAVAEAHKDRKVVGAAVAEAHKDRTVAVVVEDTCGVSCSRNF